MAPIRENDILFAYKALTFVDGLSLSAVRVGGAILDHFNHKTGQCDPSVERLAALLGMDRASVLRATKALHDAGLIEKIKHGGHSHRTCYLPCWAKLNAVVADWSAAMKGVGSRVESKKLTSGIVAKMRPSQSQECDFDSRRIATQTYRSNLANKPEHEDTDGRQAEPERKRSDSGREKKLRDEKQRRRALARASTSSSSAVARERAQERLVEDMRQLGWEALAWYVEWLTPETADLNEAAVTVEMQKRGRGKHLLLKQLSGFRLEVGQKKVASENLYFGGGDECLATSS